MEKGNKKIINAWAFYDWANSVYPLIVSTSIFPLFYAAHLKKVDLGVDPDNTIVEFFGMQLSDTVVYSFVVSFSYLIVSLLSPMLSGVSDYAGNKKGFLRFFAFLGALSVASLYFFNPFHLEWSMMSIFFASIGFWSSLVFYNSYLPEIADKKDHDWISARGFSMGYIGSSLLLIIILVLLNSFNTFTEPIIEAKESFLIVGAWWIIFSHITFRYMPKLGRGHKVTRKILILGFRELKKVWAYIKTTVKLKRFLYGFFMISTGVQTIMSMAVLFADKVVFRDIEDKSGLITAVLLIQFIAIPGAIIMGRVSSKIGNIKTIIITLFIWVFVCLYAYFVVKEPISFYILAGIVGFVMGGTQSLTRSTYSKLLPETDDTASFFSFYDVTEKIGMVIGVFLFGFVEFMTGDIRQSVLSVMVFFIAGVLLLKWVPKEDKS